MLMELKLEKLNLDKIELRMRNYLCLTLIIIQIACKNNIMKKENSTYSAKEFHQLIIKNDGKNIIDTEIIDLLLERLENENYTYDDTIIEIIRNYKNSKNNKSVLKKRLILIDKIIKQIPERYSLTAMLFLIKSQINENINDGFSKESKLNYNEAVNMFQDLQLFVDRNRIYSMLKLGQHQFVLGTKKEAEKTFLDILSYTWYLIEDEIIMQELKDYYIQAGIGLINCRKGNIEELNNIFFVPAVEKELIPILNNAKKECK